MRYFKAFEIVDKPFIKWEKWADSFAQLTAMGEDDNPLILPENEVPPVEYGVCPLKVVSGELVDRTTIEMEAFEAEYNDEVFLVDQKSKLLDVNNGSFPYDSQTFPMDERSRLFYYGLSVKPPAGDVKCMTLAGDLYNLSNANITAFLGAYYTQLIALTQPDV